MVCPYPESSPGHENNLISGRHFLDGPLATIDLIWHIETTTGWTHMRRREPTLSTNQVPTMPINKLRAFLDENHVKYVVISHSRAFTAQEVAASAHIPGREVAKTVIVKVGGKMSMAVLPATFHVDFEMLQTAIGSGDVVLATEEEFCKIFPDCQTGAMPPFGNLYGIPTYVAEALAEDEEIAFNAGSHTELVRMDYSDYERLTSPILLRFAEKDA